MKVKALQTIIHNGARHRPNSVFDLPEIDAKVLIQQRFAVSAEDTSAPAAEPAKAKATAKPAATEATNG